MYKKIVFGVVLFAVLTAILAACSIRDEATVAGISVHMGGANFTQSSVTIKKGDSLTLVDDVAVQHIIKNGRWNGGAPAPATESGAPTVSLTLNGNDSASVGPFTTSGTFHIFCTIHPGMNLDVIVQ